MKSLLPGNERIAIALGEQPPREEVRKIVDLLKEYNVGDAYSPTAALT